jgi:exonuclease VII small subunit
MMIDNLGLFYNLLPSSQSRSCNTNPKHSRLARQRGSQKHWLVTLKYPESSTPDQGVTNLDQGLGTLDWSVTILDQGLATLDWSVTTLDQVLATLDQSVTTLDQGLAINKHKITAHR